MAIHRRMLIGTMMCSASLRRLAQTEKPWSELLSRLNRPAKLLRERADVGKQSLPAIDGTPKGLVVNTLHNLTVDEGFLKNVAEYQHQVAFFSDLVDCCGVESNVLAAFVLLNTLYPMQKLDLEVAPFFPETNPFLCIHVRQGDGVSIGNLHITLATLGRITRDHWRHADSIGLIVFSE